MRILAIHSKTGGRLGNPVDLWRIYRPLKELAKHVDWQIDHSASLIKQVDKYKDKTEFTEDELETSVAQLKDYDVVFVSYWNMTAHLLAMMHVVEKRYGTKLVIDMDDDVYDIPYYNPIWLKVNVQEVEDYKQIVSICPNICVTNQHLAKKVGQHNPGRIFTIPNYISEDYQHEPVDNGKDVVIGYFGGSSHYRDLHRTGLFPALEKLMHKYKNVRFVCVGQPVDHYLPKARTSVVDAVNGTDWHDKLFPTLNFDIAVAPLQDDGFAEGKSNIKWQESTRMGAAFIASDVGPYRSLKKSTALLTPNTEEAWYIALETLVTDATKRKKQLKTAQAELDNWRLEDHWSEYKTMFEEVANA